MSSLKVVLFVFLGLVGMTQASGEELSPRATVVLLNEDGSPPDFYILHIVI